MINDKKIIFLTYLTNYNINEIYNGLRFPKMDDFIEHYLKTKNDSKEFIGDKFVEDARIQSREKYEEMIYLGIKFISVYDSEFPVILKNIYQCPPLLYYKGDLKSKINIAVVGTRVMSEFASDKINSFIEGLSDNFGIVSGLALGVDSVAHNSAINHKIYTLAVLANSLEHIYPKENYKLANEILQANGALISELPIGINRGKKSFVERNRLQSGLSDFVYPIEMGIKSGTMHTVEFCIRQGRHLLINKIPNAQKNLEQYSGIKLVLKKHYENTHRFNDKISINDLNKIINPNTKLTLF